MNTTTKKSSTKSISDEYGNLILIKNTGKRLQIKLKLISKKHYRLLGVVNEKAKSVKIVRERSKHLFLKNKSYGFNYSFLSSAKKFDKINLEDEYSRWTIPVDYLLKEGEFLFFKEQGFEKQIFIQLEKIIQFKKQKLL